MTRVAGVPQDRPDGGLAPGKTVTMGVAEPVVAAGGGDSLSVEPLGDRVGTLIAEVLGEDPLADRSRVGGGFERVEPLAVGGLGRVGVRAGVH